jgi:ArsR family transcriptional regulator, cadmium/lead-responsive transcriptional repressor
MQTYDFTTKLFRGFADSSRLAILDALQEGERCVSGLVVTTGLTQSNVSGHLSCLRDCGLVVSRQEGRFVHCRLTDPQVAEMLRSAHTIVSLCAAHSAVCANHGRDGRTPEEDTRS